MIAVLFWFFSVLRLMSGINEFKIQYKLLIQQLFVLEEIRFVI